MATVQVRFWAGAQRAAGRAQEELDAATVADLRGQLGQRPGLGPVIAVASFLVNGSQLDDQAALPGGATVDVLPPFAGG